MIKFYTESTKKWMPCPNNSFMYPGLAFLVPLDQFVVVEELDALHQIIERQPLGHTIYNNAGEKVFISVKKNKHKKFAISIYNIYGNEVIELKKPYPLFFETVRVWAPPGNFIGSVVTRRGCLSRTFTVKNRDGKAVFKINPKQSTTYDIYSIHANKVIGLVMRNWHLSPVMEDNNITAHFPATIDVNEKVTILGACFLLNALDCKESCTPC